MKPVDYIAISGYHRPAGFSGRDGFFKTWMKNVEKMSPQPKQLIIIADSGAIPPMDDLPHYPPFQVTVIPLLGDLGNCHMLLNKIKPHKFSGWTGVVLAGAMLAYTNETDMIFVEEDMLQFGDCVGRMYDEIGDGGIIFGNCNFMPAAQSLFLVRHFYIPEFVKLFLSQDTQQLAENLGEHVFARLQQQQPDMWKRFSFGYDRSRPVNYKDEVFYMQQIKPEEMDTLSEMGLI